MRYMKATVRLFEFNADAHGNELVIRTASTKSSSGILDFDSTQKKLFGSN